MEAAAKSKCQKNEERTKTEYNNICKTVLMSTLDVRIWIEHIGLTSERRKAGAKKAAETRARKRKDRDQGKITFKKLRSVLSKTLRSGCFLNW